MKYKTVIQIESRHKDEETELYGNLSRAIAVIEQCKEFTSILPEVRTNLVYAASDAKTTDDVVGIDGRITVLNNMPYAVGKPRFGVSSHMARLILELMKVDPSIRAGINFVSTPVLEQWLKRYCEQKGWKYSTIDRTKEPKKVIEKEGASMPWKIKEAIKAAHGVVPKIFNEIGAVGKEDLFVLVGKNPLEIATEACEIARTYTQCHRPMPKVGKIDLTTFTSYLLQRLGKKDSTVIVPPLTGVDAAVIDIGNDNVLIIAEDPIFSIPKQPLEMFGWYTVHIGASDIAVMGVKPRYMTYSLLMPPETSNEDMRTIIDSIHNTALELDISIVGGHTGYYPSFLTPTIGGVTVFSIAKKNEYVTPAGAQPGDDLILTKGPAIETTGILAVLREKELQKSYPQKLIEKGKAMCKQMTVIQDALTAMETGGVTAMHDATEGGVIGGLFEIANASNVGMEVDESFFIIPEEVKMVCDAFHIDPVVAIAEGSLLITASSTYSNKIIRNLKKKQINASIIGTVTNRIKTRTLTRLSGKNVPLAIPTQDPFWPVFFEGIGK
jgi:hydrogenase maturation factor/predicted fused transcriptional regulator/phosphomethylpyrimidine kinase